MQSETHGFFFGLILPTLYWNKPQPLKNRHLSLSTNHTTKGSLNFQYLKKGILPTIRPFYKGVVPGTFTSLKWSLVPPDFKMLYKIVMKIVQILIKITTCKRVKYLVDLKNNESPDCYNVLKPTTITRAPVSVIISLLSTLYICGGVGVM